MARIVDVATATLQLGLKGALRWGKQSSLQQLEHVLLRLRSDSGHVGIAEAPVRPSIYGETVASIQAIVHHYLAPALLGLELEDTAAFAQALSSVAHNPCAKGALDIAWHALRASEAGQSLYQAEHGEQQRLQVSYILGISSLEESLEEAQRVYAQGVRLLKVKVGRDAAHDQRLLTALQQEFSGSGLQLYADANESFQVSDAAQRLEQLSKLGVLYVEEPLPVHKLRDRAALRAQGILPIIADDSCFTLEDLERELEADSFDILNIKPARSGYSHSAQMLHKARAASKGVMLGSQASSGLGTLHCAIFASKAGVSHPSELSFPLKLERDILNQAFDLKTGYLERDSLASLQLANPDSYVWQCSSFTQ